MAKASLAIPAINAGEWWEGYDARTDLEGYVAGCWRLQNFTPIIQGPGEKRAGTRFLAEVKDSSDQTWLVPFRRSRAVSYVLEFGDSYVRFYFNRALVLTGSAATITGVTEADPGVVTTSAAHGYSNGQDVFISGVGGMTELNSRWFRVANVTSTTFELQDMWSADVDTSGYTSFTSGGSVDAPYEVASPYNAAALKLDNGEFGLEYAQSNDVLYITDRRGVLQPRTLSRTSSTSWAFATLDPDDGPYLAANATDTTMYIGAATGTGVTVTASSSVFTADMVGALIRIDQEILTSTDPWETGTAYTTNDYVRSEGHEYQAENSDTSGTTTPSHTTGTVTDGAVEWEYITSGYGVARITAQAGTTATVDVITPFPQTTVGSGNASTLWRLGAWSDDNGYPEVVSFFLNRIAFGQQGNIYYSQGSKFDSFAPDEKGEITDESAISIELNSDQINTITGMVAGRAQHLIFTEGAEWTIERLQDTGPFGPTNVETAEQTAYGSRPVRSIRIGESALFVTATGEKLRELRYSIEADNQVANDMTVRANHIMKGAVTQTSWQNEPYKAYLATRSDGQLLNFPFDRDQSVFSWSRFVFGGSFSSGAAVCESVATIASPSNDRDDPFVIVKRTINGATKRYVEYIPPAYEDGDDLEDAVYVDSSLVYDDTSTSSVRGLDHLKGETVSLLVDGAVQPDATVSSDGVVAFTYAGSTAQIGYSYDALYASMRLDGGARDGTSQAKLMRIPHVHLRVYRSLGGQLGLSETDLTDIPDLNYRSPAALMGAASALVSGDVQVRTNERQTREPRIWLKHSVPLPMTLLGVYPSVRTQDNNN